MSARTAHGESAPQIDRASIVRGLREVGIAAGDRIGVHASLSAFGHVIGGAATVVEALCEAVGESGAVVVPAYSANREAVARTDEETRRGVSWKFRLSPLDRAGTPCWTGAIPEALRMRPGAVRGTDLTHSLAAWGAGADTLCTGWQALLEADGTIVLLGVTFGCCSSLHLAEREVELPGEIRDATTLPADLRRTYPEGAWDIGYGPYPDFGLAGRMAEEQGLVRQAAVGTAVVRAVSLRRLVSCYAAELRADPYRFYGSR